MQAAGAADQTLPISYEDLSCLTSGMSDHCELLKHFPDASPDMIDALVALSSDIKALEAEQRGASLHKRAPRQAPRSSVLKTPRQRARKTNDALNEQKGWQGWERQDTGSTTASSDSFGTTASSDSDDAFEHAEEKGATQEQASTTSLRKRVRFEAVGAGVGAMVSGAGGGVAGAVAGLPLALVTFGLSIPICASVGAGVGTLGGAVSGGVAGHVVRKVFDDCSATGS